MTNSNCSTLVLKASWECPKSLLHNLTHPGGRIMLDRMGAKVNQH